MLPFFGFQMLSVKCNEAKSPASYFGTSDTVGDRVYVSGHQSDDPAISVNKKIR